MRWFAWLPKHTDAEIERIAHVIRQGYYYETRQVLHQELAKHGLDRDEINRIADECEYGAEVQ